MLMFFLSPNLLTPPLRTSCERGWELLCICLNFFPPSNKFFNYLAGYISKHTDGVQQGDVIAYAEHALKKLDRVKQTGAKRGKQEPTLDEVEHARVRFGKGEWGRG